MPAKKTTKKTTAKAEETVKQAQEFWTEGFEKAKEQWTKALSGDFDMGEFHKENFEAVVESATAVSQSFEKIATEAADFQKKSFEDGVAVANQTLGATSVQDALEIQGEFAKSAFEAYSAHFNKIGEMWGEGARASFAPLNSRFEGLFAGYRG